MNVRKMLYVLGLLLAVTIMVPTLHADDWNQTTRFTFSQPVRIPGQVLPAGTYRFQLASTNNRHLVQIFREDRTLAATLYSIPRVRQGHGTEVAITLANRGGTQPEAIVAWFFVGEAEGHEFLYPKAEKQELAHSTHVTLVTGD